jgi:hypothetical protein
MKPFAGIMLLFLVFDAPRASAQTRQVQPQIVTETDLQRKVTVVKVAPRFVTAVRLPEAVNSVVVGDPSRFLVEHTEREPELVFVKATSAKAAETNLLISMTNGRQVSLLLVSRGDDPSGGSDQVDFLLKFEPAGNFFVPTSAFPSELVGETVPLPGAQPPPRLDAVGGAAPLTSGALAAQSDPKTSTSLDQLLEQQKIAPLPALYGQRITEESASGDRVRAGVSRVIDGGQQVIVLFSVMNPTKHAILLMPPQVQLSGSITSGKVFHHKRWSTAEQLPVVDFRLSKRRIGPGERADGVVLFERPPYKQSNETLLLQVAESGAVDRPALAPIGFGISTASEGQHGRGK